MTYNLCSSCEKIKQNKEKYEQEKFEKELEHTTKMVESIYSCFGYGFCQKEHKQFKQKKFHV